VLGLTGSYGSGKSTVAALFRELGVRVIDADALAREAVEPGQPANDEIREMFGPEVFLPDGRIDRQEVGRIVFNDPRMRRALEAIIHPRVREQERRLVAEAAAAGEELVVLDVPLLFESGMDAECDRTCVVVVDDEQRMERLGRLGIAPEDVRRRLAAQMPQEEKARRADFVIENSGTVEQTRQQAVCVKETLTSQAGMVPPKE